MNAMIEEMDSIEVNETLFLVGLPRGKKEINVKWLYKVKLIPKVEMILHKARPLAKGFLKNEGANFDEVFAPVSRIKTVSLIVALTNINN